VSRPTGPSPRNRLALILLLLVIVGVPVMVTTALITQDVVGEVTQGDQPGGTLSGEVVDEDGHALAGEGVVLVCVSPERERTVAGRTKTDADGRFELRAPACQGSYELHAGGGTRRRVARGISFLDRDGEPIQPRPVTLELGPGAALELTFLKAGKPAGPGRYVLDGRERRGLLFGLVPYYGVHSDGAIEDGVLRLDGLPPMQARLTVRFESGESVDLDLDLRPGVNARHIEL
jgi:hypothetical protein